jgi:hypothetical protein
MTGNSEARADMAVQVNVTSSPRAGVYGTS